MKLKRDFGAERDYEFGHGAQRNICPDCGLDFYDVEGSCWALNADMSRDLDRGISGFAPDHERCKVCERKR